MAGETDSETMTAPPPVGAGTFAADVFAVGADEAPGVEVGVVVKIVRAIAGLPAPMSGDRRYRPDR